MGDNFFGSEKSDTESSVTTTTHPGLFNDKGETSKDLANQVQREATARFGQTFPTFEFPADVDSFLNNSFVKDTFAQAQNPDFAPSNAQEQSIFDQLGDEVDANRSVRGLDATQSSRARNQAPFAQQLANQRLTDRQGVSNLIGLDTGQQAQQRAGDLQSLIRNDALFQGRNAELINLLFNLGQSGRNDFTFTPQSNTEAVGAGLGRVGIRQGAKLAGAGAGASVGSDIRIKRDISKVGTLSSGLGVYTFKYIWDNVERIGVMAQEVLGLYPEAVSTHPMGYYMVDYSRIA